MYQRKEPKERLYIYRTRDGGLLAISKPTVSILKPIVNRRPANIQNSIFGMLLTGMANPFEYWVTISLNSYDDVEAYRRWREHHHRSLKYVEVAAQAKSKSPYERSYDKRWHIHALMSGIPMRELQKMPIVKPLTKYKQKSEPQQRYRWYPLDEYFLGNVSMVHCIGDPNWDGGKIEQPGKAIYMVRQFESTQPDMFQGNRRLFNRSQGLCTDLELVEKETISTDRCIRNFQDKRVFPYGCTSVDYLRCVYAHDFDLACAYLFDYTRYLTLCGLIPLGAPF